MKGATRLEQPLPGIYRWAYDSPEHRVELTSHAIRTATGVLIFDPIPLVRESVEELTAGALPAAIILTNANHVRAAATWQARLGCRVFGPREASAELAGVEPFDPTQFPLPGWTVVGLPGGAPGESAFLHSTLSLAIFGDAVVHLPGRGLEILPTKYCTNAEELRASLRHFLSQSFSHALFAHGQPLTSKASERISALL